MANALLTSSIEKRLNNLMVRLLTDFETKFSDIKNSEAGQRYRFDVKTMVNDVLRATRDELNDYDIEYRPLRINANNTISMTTTFMQSIESVDFVVSEANCPSLIMRADQSAEKVMAAVRKELNCGVLYIQENQVILQVSTIMNCAEKVLPFIDKYMLSPKLREKYKVWRACVVEAYNG